MACRLFSKEIPLSKAYSVPNNHEATNKNISERTTSGSGATEFLQHRNAEGSRGNANRGWLPTHKNEQLVYLRLLVTSTLVHPMADLLLWLILSQKYVSSLGFMKLIHSRQGMKWDIWCGRSPRASKIQINAHPVTDWQGFCEGRVLPLTDITHFTFIPDARSLDFLYPRLYRDSPCRSLTLCMCRGGPLISVLLFSHLWIVQHTSTEHRFRDKH